MVSQSGNGWFVNKMFLPSVRVILVTALFEYHAIYTKQLPQSSQLSAKIVDWTFVCFARSVTAPLSALSYQFVELILQYFRSICGAFGYHHNFNIYLQFVPLQRLLRVLLKRYANLMDFLLKMYSVMLPPAYAVV